MNKHVVVLGGGLAGLSCAYEMARKGLRVTVVEREPAVGGMATSFEEGDRATAGEPDSDYWSYDFGPHRFHTDEKELLGHIQEILGENQVWRKRLSRIFLFDRFYNYPLELQNVLRNMHPFEIVRILFDYVWVRLQDALRLKDYQDRNFSEWVEKRFGRALADIFFIQYTEKAWGIPATEISSVWASQRISLLSLTDTIIKTVFRPRNAPRTLVTDFVYPRLGGIGELARGYQRRIEAMGGTVIADAPAIRIHREGARVTGIEYRRDGERQMLEGDHYISTMPVTELARRVTPRAPDAVHQGLQGLGYVSVVFVYLRVARDKITDDHWIYLPQKHLKVHRISEFKNFSPVAAPPGKTMVCAELTCRVGDELWRGTDEELTEIATKDLATVGLIEPHEVFGSFIKRIPFGYPLYDLDYEGNLKAVMDFVHAFENLESGGRQGLFRYNNMDQSIEMGRMMAARLAGETDADHESVATEQRYFG
ncbi:MAG: FAD-dependent oxidoreductase [Myxococcales bacterium]|nr:FAD-dependent oxidoreductase [Myxococcales bacterium]